MCLSTIAFLAPTDELIIVFFPPWGSLGGSDSREFAGSAGDLGSIPGLGRCPGEGNGYPLQYSCLENSMDREAWWATAHNSLSFFSYFVNLQQKYSQWEVTFKKKTTKKPEDIEGTTCSFEDCFHTWRLKWVVWDIHYCIYVLSLVFKIKCFAPNPSIFIHFLLCTKLTCKFQLPVEWFSMADTHGFLIHPIWASSVV